MNPRDVPGEVPTSPGAGLPERVDKGAANPAQPAAESFTSAATGSAAPAPAGSAAPVAAGSAAPAVAGPPASAAPMPGKADSDGWRRLHPLSPLLRGGLALVIVLGVIIANFRDIIMRMFVSGSPEAVFEDEEFAYLFSMLPNGQVILIGLGLLLAVVLVIVGLSWIAWRFHTYRITGDAVEARSGVVFRQHRRAPLDRVQSVNLQRPLLARMLGLTKIEVLTGGQGGKVELAYLGHTDAKAVRERILQLAAARRSGSLAPAQADDITPAAPVSYDGTAYAAPSDGLTQRVQEFADFDVDPAAVASQSLVRVPVGRLIASILLGWESMTLVILVLLGVSWGVISAMIGAITGNPGFLAAAGISLVTILPLAVVMLGVMISQFNKGFNFTLSRGRESVRIGSGLTSTVTDSIPFGRIHALEALQPLFWRPFGWWKVRVTLAGHSVSEAGQSVTQNVVLPVGRHDDVVRVIETLIPGAVDGIREGLIGPGTGYVGAGRRAGWLLLFAKRRAGVRIDVPLVAQAETGQTVSGYGGTTSVVAERDETGQPLTEQPVAAPHRDPAAEPSPALEPNLIDATLRIRRGALTRSLAIMPIVRAQSVQLSRPLVHYLFGLASLQAHTVLGPVRMSIRGLDVGTARNVFDELAATVLRVQAAESASHPASQRRAAEATEAAPAPGAAGAPGSLSARDASAPLDTSAPLSTPVAPVAPVAPVSPAAPAPPVTSAPPPTSAPPLAPGPSASPASPAGPVVPGEAARPAPTEEERTDGVSAS